VADHQTVSMRFANGVTANFIMSGFTAEIRRSVSLFGTAGEINVDMEANTVWVSEFASKNTEIIELGRQAGGHSGGDGRFITDFISLARGSGGDGKNMIRDSFESHYMAFAAEQSRVDAKVVRLEDFKRR
jgi:predicted dehydrogenase